MNLDNDQGQSDRDAIDSAASAITRYLSEHPNSADTLEGVIDWWLVRQRIKDSERVVGGALEQLISSGIVCRETQPGGRVVYRVVRCQEPI